MKYKCECGQVHDDGINRRNFMGLGASAVFGYALTRFAHPIEVVAQGGYPVRNTAEFCILINMNGGPSHSDLFDVKSNGSSSVRVRPDADEARMDVQPIAGTELAFPMGLLGEVAAHADKMAVARWWGWSAAHEIGQYWNFTGTDRNPAFQAERPNIGAVVASEFSRTGRRRADDVLPGFVSLSGLPYQNGFLSGEFAPFTVAANPNGLGGLLQHPEGGTDPARFNSRWNLLQSLDAANRGANPPLGKPAEDLTKFYGITRNMMYNTVVDNAFRFTVDDARRYSPRPDLTPNGTGEGNACIVARNLLRANKGTRFVWVSTFGWDMHDNIYESLFDSPITAVNNNGTGRRFSKALGELLNDLRTSPSVRTPGDPNRSLLDDTLVIINGDFGRTPARRYTFGTGLNTTNGRDHWGNVSFVTFIGGGIRGGRMLGVTDETGDVIDPDYPGWDAFARTTRRPRTTGGYPNAGPWIRLEDCYFSMYSALGIDPTVRYSGTPSGRDYELIYRQTDIFSEIAELW